jgi:hypothetical protein
LSAFLLAAIFALITFKARGAAALLFPTALFGIVCADLVLTGHGLEDQPFRIRLIAAVVGCAVGVVARRRWALRRQSNAPPAARR